MSAMQVASSTFQPVNPRLERIREQLAKDRKPVEPEPVKYDPWADFRIYRATSGNIKGLFGLAQIFHEGSGKTAKVTERVLAEGVDMHIIVGKVRDAINARMNQRRK